MKYSNIYENRSTLNRKMTEGARMRMKIKREISTLFNDHLHAFALLKKTQPCAGCHGVV